MPLPLPAPLALAVVGAGPVGLALALHAARQLPAAKITLYDARPVELDVTRDPRTIALSLGSVQQLERLGAWDAAAAQPILAVHVSQQPPTARPFGADAELRIGAREQGVPLLGAVLAHGRIVAPLQAAWLEAARREPQRLQTRFGTPVRALKDLAAGVEVDAGIVDTADLAVVAEGGVFADAKPSLGPAARRQWQHDYRQTAWIGQVTLAREHGGTAWERFTRQGPAALLPLPREAPGAAPRAALVWCVPADDDPVAELGDAQRLAVLNTVFPRAAGPLIGLSALKAFPLGLQAERSLVGHAGDAPPADARARVVRIGNAAQRLHPVAGQGLNLGLRDAVELVHALERAGADVDAALRRVEWRRAPDRLSMIAATDFLARSFTWALPGAGWARGLGLAALQAFGPARSLLARQMMFGAR